MQILSCHLWSCSWKQFKAIKKLLLLFTLLPSALNPSTKLWLPAHKTHNSNLVWQTWLRERSYYAAAATHKLQSYCRIVYTVFIGQSSVTASSHATTVYKPNVGCGLGYSHCLLHFTLNKVLFLFIYCLHKWLTQSMWLPVQEYLVQGKKNLRMSKKSNQSILQDITYP